MVGGQAGNQTISSTSPLRPDGLVVRTCHHKCQARAVGLSPVPGGFRRVSVCQAVVSPIFGEEQGLD